MTSFYKKSSQFFLLFQKH